MHSWSTVPRVLIGGSPSSCPGDPASDDASFASDTVSSSTLGNGGHVGLQVYL
jgi:hypothetical protein